MAPPLPPSSKSPRRRSKGNTNSTDTHRTIERSKNEIGDVAPRLASRRYREDESRPAVSKIRYERGTRRPPSLSSATGEYVRDDKRNLPPSPSATTKPKSTMTSEDEIERMRELRARRQKAEQQERGEDQQYEKKERMTNLNSNSTTNISARRSSLASIARQDLEKSGLVRKNRRRPSIGIDSPSNVEGLSSSGDELDNSDTTKITDTGSKRDDIQARLAARRSRRYSGDGPRRIAAMPKKNKSLSIGNVSSAGDEVDSTDIPKNKDVGSMRSDIQARLSARRRQSSGKDDSSLSIGELSSYGGEHDSSDTTKISDLGTKRSDLQARLAARRRQSGGKDEITQRNSSNFGGLSRFEDEIDSSDTVKGSDVTSKRSDIQARLAARRRQASGTENPAIHRNNSSNYGGMSGSGDELESSDTTKILDSDSKRSDIQARLAARRSRRFSGDGPYRSTTTSKRHTSETFETSNEQNTSPIQSNLSRNSRRSYSGNMLSDTEIADSTLQTEVTSQPLPPTRTSSNAISERLRERREARERDRKEREKKYDFKGLLTGSELTQTNDATTVERVIKDEDKSRSGRRNVAGNLVMNSRIGVSGENGSPKCEEWSVKLCVISAMDLTSNVVPNMPLCPVLKMGLVHLPNTVEDNTKENIARSVIMEELNKNSIETMKSAMVRSTTHKILSKRDNGAIDFHQEYRWDRLDNPRLMGLCVELSARAIRTPSNYMLSPPANLQQETSDSQRNASATDLLSVEKAESSRPTGGSGPPAGRGVNRTSSLDAGVRGLWNRNTKKQNAEMQAAEAAAAVARILVDESGAEAKNEENSKPVSMKISETTNIHSDVTLRSDTERINIDLTRDVRLGSVMIPLTRLPKNKGVKKNETVRLEEWYQLETGEEATDAASQRKKPSIFLEISLSSSEALDDSEDELEECYSFDNDKQELLKSSACLNASFSRRACIEALNQTDEHERKKEKPKTEDPALEPGVVDFVAVVGCKDIGNQKNDDGMKGWVKTNAECVILEQFPPNNEFHLQSGRKSLLPEMLQWFCYPEGARLWRGTAPPSHSDLNLKHGSPSNVESSIATFDACLGCATSFSWFVIASNSDEYGSSLVKTYGAVIRFYVPAPTGIDSTQDDFAQAIMGGKLNLSASAPVKRLWVPIAICMTSSLPIIGVMEALLLRTCEELSTISDATIPAKLEEIHQAIGNIILNYQKPIAGAVNCSMPFLAGDRFLLSLPPRTCLPPLPHGRAILSVLRLLGAEGLNYLIAAVLSECKILIHSEDIAEIAMVAEVITTLTYPFAWSLPYIPVLPIGMIEFVEAPLSYLLGIPSCNLRFIDPRALDETVVINLNEGFTSEGNFTDKIKSKSEGSKHPPSLPTSTSTNLSNAFHKLLHAEELMEEEYGGSDLLGENFPRLESESLAEREFRVSVAIEVCGLLRGYQDCVGPVFDRDKFLKTAPALYEERREYKTSGGRSSGRGVITEKTKVLSSRSKRFLSSLISGQNFQQFLENLDNEETAFFHEVLEIIDDSTSDRKSLKRSLSDDFDLSQADKNVALLMKSFQKNEDKIPTFCVEKWGGIDPRNDQEDQTLLSLIHGECEFENFDAFYPNAAATDSDEPLNFMKKLLSSIEIESTTAISDSGMQAVSMEYLTKLETTPWQYSPIFNLSSQIVQRNDKLKLREAIGERRFRAWKLARDKKTNHDEDLAFLSGSAPESAKRGSALDLTTLVTSAKNDSIDSPTLSSNMSSLTPAQQRIAAAKSRDIIRRCLDRANIVQTSELDQVNPFVENGRDLMAEAEKNLRNPSAQLFLVSILGQRSRLENKRTRTMRHHPTVSNSASRLDRIAFDCLIRLSCAMLDSCMECKGFEMAYRLLTNSAGFITVQEVDSTVEDENDAYGDEQSMIVITMTSRIGLHPIFADIGVWEAVMNLHLRDRKAVKKLDEFKSYDVESDDEEEEEVEYEAAVATLYEMVGYGIPGEELSRFAMRTSQEHGWFCDDRGRQLLMLARRISIRRDQADTGGTGNTGDIDMVRKGRVVSEATLTRSESSSRDKSNFAWKEVAWCHPAAPSRTAVTKSDERNVDLEITSATDNYMKRTPVTALASFGSSIVASGGLDGGVFLAHSITLGSRTEDSSFRCDQNPKVKGLHLDWGSASRARTGSTSDGEYGVGAVSCLAAAYGDSSHDPSLSSTKDTRDKIDELDMAESMEGSRIIAGTTAGDLRVWSVKDIYSSISTTKNDQEARNAHNISRFKYSLRGRALSGHRGGVTCIDVPSQVYRPDSLVTGGADGLIKLWALRAPTGSRRTNATNSNEVDTLSGHSGRILCIRTAWHGDHLISGGADRTIRVWDLATSGGKCIHKLYGHFGWITNVQYWGPNTIVSASTDRSVALWDARVRSSALFILRNHQSPISDLLVGSRTDPYMVSAAADGTIATWDFRLLSDSSATEQPGFKDSSSKGCKIVRIPSASMRHNLKTPDRAVGSVHLSRDVIDPMSLFLSVGSDAILRKWNITTGEMIEESPTGHCDTITCFESYAQSHGAPPQTGISNGLKGNNSCDMSDKGFLTSSLDGTVMMRKLVEPNND